MDVFDYDTHALGNRHLDTFGLADTHHNGNRNKD